MRLTYEHKQAREQARYYGKRCRIALEHFASHVEQATGWRAFGTDADENVSRWDKRADDSAAEAYYYARKAAHHARQGGGK